MSEVVPQEGGMVQPSPALAADLDKLEMELLQALYAKARNDFHTFVALLAPAVSGSEFVDGEHIRLMCKELMTVEATPHARLMITMPPRSGKSMITNILFPAWVFGRNPQWMVMCLSHTTNLAADFGREVRDLILNDSDYAAIFPYTRIDPNNRNALRWATTRKGKYNAAGATTSIAGKGAHIGIADDLLSEQTAYSKGERDKVKANWARGFRSRLMPQGRLVIVSTRYHEDDVIGWLLRLSEQGGVDKWRVINIPAIVMRGGKEESYWPGWRPLEELKAIRDDPALPKSQWNALYMGNPTPEEGVMIRPEDFQLWDKPPPTKFVAKILSIDSAFSAKETADFSVIQCWGIFMETHRDSRGREFQVPSVLALASRRRWAR